jgi:hypothetical protein
MLPPITVPTAPIPTQTLYAVPTGMWRIAILKSHMLATMAITVRVVGRGRVNPTVYFKPTAQATSKMPAMLRINHGMIFPLKS